MSARIAITVLILVALARTAPVHAQLAIPARANALRQVAYPVADLVVPVDMDVTKPQQSSATIEDKLIQLVCRTCEANTWADVGGPGTINYMPKDMTLVVRQTARCQERIRELLAELRKLQDTQVSIATRYLTLSPARAKQLEVLGDRGNFGKFLPADGPDAVCLSDREVSLLFAFAQGDLNTSIVAAPKMTMFNGQKGALSVSDQVGVKDGDVDQDSKAITSAWVGVGMRNVYQAVVEPEDDSVRLALECSVTAQSEKAGRGRVFATRKIKHVVRVPQNQTVALKLGADAKGQQQYVFLTPRVVRESEVSMDKRPADEPAAQGKRSHDEVYARVHPIADLLAPIVADPTTAAPRLGAAKRTLASRNAEPVTAQLLVDLITANIAPTSWKGEREEGAIQFYPLGQALVVLHRKEVQEEINGLLAALRRLRDLRVSLDCRIVELPDAVAARITLGKSSTAEAVRSAPRQDGAEEQDRTVLSYPAPPRSVGTTKSLLQFSSLSANEARELRQQLAEEGPAVVEHVLGAVTFNGYAVRIDKSRPYTYTTDINVTLVEGRVVVKPVTSTVRLGTVIEALPIVKAGGEGVSLEIKTHHRSLDHLAPTKTVRVGPRGEETEVVLQTPSVNTRSVHSVVNLDKMETLVLPLGATMSESRNEYGTPVLSKVPYLSRLFSTVGYGREVRQAYLVITPQIHAR